MSSTTPFVLTLAAALLVGAATGQQFSPSRTLPLDDTPAPAAGNQRRPTVALGPNGISLVAWQDDRSSLLETVFGITGESNLPGNFDIQAMLLDAQGQPLASTPILVNGDTWDQERPRVAWNGSAWLVVFESTKPTTVFYSRGIYAVRIAADGTVLDHTPLRVDDDDNVDEMFPVVASLGGNWLVAWSDVGANGAELQGAIVGPAGTVGSRQTLLAGSGSAAATQFESCAANGQLAIAYSLAYGNGIRVARFGPTLAAIGAPLVLAPTQGSNPAIGTDGSGFYVAWFGGGTPRGTPIDTAGTIAIPGGTPLAMIGNNSECAVGHDGQQWTVAVDATPSVLATWVAANGTPSSTVTVTTSSRSVDDIAVGNGLGRTVVLWTDRRTTPNSFGTDYDDVFCSSLTSAGGASQATAVSVSPPAQVAAAIAGDPATGFLCVCKSLEAGITRFLAYPLDAFGNLLAAPFIVHSGDRSLDRPDVSWNGSEFLVVWEQKQSTQVGGPPPLVRGVRVTGTGTMLDPVPLVIMEGNAPTVDAVGSTFLVVARFHHPVLQSNSIIRGRRLDGGTGLFLDASPMLIGGGSGTTDVVGLSDRWFVAWDNVAAAQVLTTGVPQPPFVAANPGSSSTSFRLATNLARDEAILVYQHYNGSTLAHLADIRMRRFTLNAASMDPMAGRVVTASNQAQLRPSIAELDGEYLAAWADHRDALDYEPGLGDVFAARLDGFGTLLDASGMAVHDSPRGEGGAFLVRTGTGTALLVASTMLAAPFGTHRLQVSTYSAAPTPWSPLGNGLGGALGIPVLTGFGSLTAGSTFQLTTTNARPTSLGVLAIGMSTLGLPVLGGVLVPSPDITLAVITDSNGMSALGSIWPAGLSGTSFYSQCWVLDLAGPIGFAATGGLRGTSP